MLNPPGDYELSTANRLLLPHEEKMKTGLTQRCAESTSFPSPYLASLIPTSIRLIGITDKPAQGLSM